MWGRGGVRACGHIMSGVGDIQTYRHTDKTNAVVAVRHEPSSFPLEPLISFPFEKRAHRVN